MMKVKLLTLFAVSLVSGCSVTVEAGMPHVDFEAEAKVTSAYVWRGRILNDEPCIQPSFTARALDFSLNVWGTSDLTDVPDSSLHERVDATIHYTHEQGRQIFDAGVISYVYPHDAEEGPQDTFEALLGYALDVPLLPSLTVYYDLVEIGGFYVSLGLAHSFVLVRDKLALDLGVTVGGADEHYNNELFGLTENETAQSSEVEADGVAPEIDTDKVSAVGLTLTATFPVTLGEHFEFVPGAKYVSLLDSDLRDAVEAVGDEGSETAWTMTLRAYF